MRKFLPYILIFIALVGLLSPTTNVLAQDTSTYTLLAPLPDLTTFDASAGEDNSKLGEYLNLMIKIFIGICSVLAVVMIVMGGIEYMTSELVHSKEHGKERIRGAILGLILALGAYTILYTINPDLLNTDFKSLKGVTVEVALEEQIKSYTGQGKCEPINSGICAPGNLEAAGFPNGTQASSICNGESRGNSTLGSGVDKCSDGNSFSYGLFQINILAHANEIPDGVCSNIFQTKGGGTQGACLQSKNGICLEYNCSVTNKEKYNSCVSYISNPTNNIKYAVGLQKARDWNQWGAYSSCKNTFPPK